MNGKLIPWGTTRVIGSILLLAAGLLTQAASAATYIAPPPPDSVVLRGVEPGALYDIFLSKRPPEEVRNFYAGKLGSVTTRPGMSYEAETPVLLTYQQVVDILLARHADVTLADDLKVTVRWKPPGNGQSECAGDFLRELLALSRIQHRETEFDALCKQYGYLQNAYFQRIPDPTRAGQLDDADKVLLAQVHRTQGGQQARALSRSSTEMGLQIAQLALGGHGAEANALAARLSAQANQAAGSVGDWDGWVSVLKQADAMGYRTWVAIPRDPRTWGAARSSNREPQ